MQKWKYGCFVIILFWETHIVRIWVSRQRCSWFFDFITQNPLSVPRFICLSLSAPSSFSLVNVIELQSQFESRNFEKGFWCYGFCDIERNEILKRRRSKEQISESGFFLFLEVMAQNKPNRLYQVWKGNNVSFLPFLLSIGFTPHVMKLFDHMLYWVLWVEFNQNARSY